MGRGSGSAERYGRSARHERQSTAHGITIVEPVRQDRVGRTVHSGYPRWRTATAGVADDADGSTAEGDCTLGEDAADGDAAPSDGEASGIVNDCTVSRIRTLKGSSMTRAPSQ